MFEVVIVVASYFILHPSFRRVGSGSGWKRDTAQPKHNLTHTTSLKPLFLRRRPEHKLTSKMEFFSMGMFCVDEIHTSTASHTNIIGGAGTYAALGAAIPLTYNDRKRVGFICDKGHDFDSSMFEEIQSWNLGIIFRLDQKRQTTKAWNKFVQNEERLFKYLSPKLQIFFEDLPKDAREAKCIHLICSPQRCGEFMLKLTSLNLPYQKYVWEPVPTQCLPEHFEELKKCVTEFHIDVLTPNALEAAALVGLPEPNTEKQVEDLDEQHFQFASTIVIRCGALGCYLRSSGIRKWYPAYFTDQSKIVDPSGCGNAFAGGLGIALARGLAWDQAISWATVAASYMIEQIGPPSLSSSGVWNGEDPSFRIQEYSNRIAL